MGCQHHIFFIIVISGTQHTCHITTLQETAGYITEEMNFCLPREVSLDDIEKSVWKTEKVTTDAASHIFGPILLLIVIGVSVDSTLCLFSRL